MSGVTAEHCNRPILHGYRSRRQRGKQKSTRQSVRLLLSITLKMLTTDNRRRRSISPPREETGVLLLGEVRAVIRKRSPEDRQRSLSRRAASCRLRCRGLAGLTTRNVVGQRGRVGRSPKDGRVAVSRVTRLSEHLVIRPGPSW